MVAFKGDNYMWLPGQPTYDMRPMTGQTMEPDEDMDNVRYERENAMGGDASDPLDLSTGGNKADSMSSSRPISDVHSRQEMFLPAPRQHLDIPHTTTAVTSGYTLSRSHTDIPMSRPWPFSPGSPNSIVRPFPHGDRSPPKDLARFPQPSANRTFQPERNGAPMFPGSAMDSSVEDLRDMSDVEVVSNGVENLGPLSGRPLPAAYPDGALMYNPLGPSGMLSLSLPSPYDTAHMSSLSMTAASVLNRKRRQERVDKKDKEATTNKSSPSAATVTSAQASSNSPDPGDESEPKKTKTVPDEKKDDAYWERRRKNNEAAKRSRDARRQKEEEIAVRAAWLEQENLKLRAEIAVLKNETAKLHCLLLNRRV